MKKLAVILMSVLIVFGLVACGGDKAKEEKKAEPLNLTGEWKQSDAGKDGWMEATIEGDTITVNWISDGGDTKSLYWVGTYEAPKDNAKTYEWESKGDREQMDNALLTSSEETKKFTYDGKYLTYEVSAMGTTKNMKLERVKK